MKAILTGLLGFSLCMANISGVVTDTGSTPISGAIVQLEKGGQTATSGADGSFTLATTAILPVNGNLLPKGLSVGIAGDLMTLTIAERSAVEVVTFDLNGKALSTVRQTLDAGSHIIALPQRRAGVYLYKVKSGNGEVVLKGNSVGGVSSGSGTFYQDPSPSKQAKTSVAINDIIAATKTGYLNYRCVQYNADTSGIVIKMIASAGTLTDTDGNVYQTVRIGGQVWMAENLRVTRYRDGSGIPLVTDGIAWSSICDNSLTTPVYCYYNNATDSESSKKYGALYNWYVVSPANPKKIAPIGWHVPTDVEWAVLEKYLVLNGYNWDGTMDTLLDNKIAKSLAAKTDWNTTSTIGAIGYDLTKNNKCGFLALPGGLRNCDGSFIWQCSSGEWWSATEMQIDTSGAWYRYLGSNYDYLDRYGYGSKSCGFSVRLVRDN